MSTDFDSARSRMLDARPVDLDGLALADPARMAASTARRSDGGELVA